MNSEGGMAWFCLRSKISNMRWKISTKKLIRITQRDVQAHVGRGQVYEALGDRASAIADYKKAIELRAITIGDLDDKDAQNKAKARLAELEPNK